MNRVQLHTVILSGSQQIRVTFKAGSGAGCIVDRASVGVQDTTYNTLTTPVELKFAGVSGFSLAAGASITSDWTPFRVVAPKGVVLTGGVGSSDPGWGGFSIRTVASITGGPPLIVVLDVSAGDPGADIAHVAGQDWFLAATSSYNIARPAGVWTEYAFNLGVDQIEIQ